MVHDFKNYPELTDAQMVEYELISPHPQIKSDFYAECVEVYDGDTIQLKTDFRDFKFPLRFLDIDSPEMNAGGEITRDWLRSQILGKNVQIRIEQKNRVDKYGRLLGRVYHNGLNMGDTELRLGLAVPFGKKDEGKLPSLNKELNVKKWLKI
jgi:endonuclease YncB( thermonuclease family)